MFDGIIDTIKGWVASFIEYTLWRIFWFIEIVVVKFVGFMESVMMIFTGEKTVKYNGEDNYLLNIFFEHDSVRGIYGGMALIGIIFCFVFAIISVIRKALDLRDKQQGVTMGMILGNLLKGILIISSMNLIMLVAIETTNKLVQQISYTIQNGGNLAMGGDTITFTNEQYAAMGRIINTLGNYSLNPSYKSRYNLNACYNDIRTDLKDLGDQGVFNFHYIEVDENGKTIQSWQSLMEKLATAYDYTSEVPLDSYNDGVINAVLDCMEILKANPTMRVLKTYKREPVKLANKNIPMDRILFLTGTMGMDANTAAARNPKYNKNPSFFDNARLPFYYAEDGADIYSYDDVRRVFDPSPFVTNYILVWFSSIAILKEMLVLIVTCAVRIFNLLALYIAAPLAIATMPLDDGGKFKQWTTAFIVQLLTIVGMVIAMRLFLMFIPIIWSPALKTSDNVLLDIIIKMVIQYGAVLSVNKVNGIFTGILADNAGFQAITAGDVRSNVENSAAGQMLSGMSAGNLAEKGFSKGRQKLGEGIGKVSSKAAYVSDALGITQGAYEASADKQKKDAAKEAHKSRSNKRAATALEADLKSMKETGQHLNGDKPKNEKDKQNQIKKMEKALNHMKQGDGNTSLKQAMRMAEQDMKEDKLDQQLQGKLEATRLKNPPPKRQPGPRRQTPQRNGSNSNNVPNNRPNNVNNTNRSTPGNNSNNNSSTSNGNSSTPDGNTGNDNNTPVQDIDNTNVELPNNQGQQVDNNNIPASRPVTPDLGDDNQINNMNQDDLSNQTNELNQTNQGSQVGEQPNFNQASTEQTSNQIYNTAQSTDQNSDDNIQTDNNTGNAGINMGVNPQMNTGSNPQMNTGMNSQMNSQMNSGMVNQMNQSNQVGSQNPMGSNINPGMNMGMNRQMNPGVNMGANPQMNTGSNPQMNTGMDSQMNPQMNSGMVNQMNQSNQVGSQNPMGSNINPGMNMGMNQQMNPGMNMGMNQQMNPGVNMGANPQMNQGMDNQMNMGSNPQMNTGMDTQMNSGMNSGMVNQMNQSNQVESPNPMSSNINPGMNMGMNPQMNPEMNMGMNQQMNPGVNMGANPQMNTGPNPQMKTGMDSQINSGMNSGMVNQMNQSNQVESPNPMNGNINPGMNRYQSLKDSGQINMPKGLNEQQQQQFDMQQVMNIMNGTFDNNNPQFDPNK